MQLDPQTLSRETILFPLSSSDHLEESAAQPSKRALSPRGSTRWEGVGRGRRCVPSNPTEVLVGPEPHGEDLRYCLDILKNVSWLFQYAFGTFPWNFRVILNDF